MARDMTLEGLPIGQPEKKDQGHFKLPSVKTVARTVVAGGALAAAAAGARFGLEKSQHSADVAQPVPITDTYSKVEAPVVIQAEIPKANWTITVDQKIAGTKSESPYNRTIEQDTATLTEALKVLPKIGSLEIVLTSGQRASFNYDKIKPEIFVGRELINKEWLKRDLFHEVMHYYDPGLNLNYLKTVMSEAEIVKLIELKKQALSDSVYASDVPSLEKIFTPNKSGLQWGEVKDYNPQQVASLTNFYPDLYWLVQGTDIAHSRNLFKPYINKSLELIDKFAQQPGAASWGNFNEFISANKSQFDQLKTQDAITRRALEILEQKQDLFKNDEWLPATGYSVRLDGLYIADWWRGLPYVINGILGQGVEEGDSSITNLFPSADLPVLKVNLDNLKYQAEFERFAEIGRATFWFGKATSATPFISELQLIAADKAR